MTNNSNDDQYAAHDCLSEKDIQALEREQESILDALHKKVRESDAARQWLDTELGRSFRKYLAADKMRAMKLSTTAKTKEARDEARMDYAVVVKLEEIFGSILVDGQEAIQQLQNIHEGDTSE